MKRNRNRTLPRLFRLRPSPRLTRLPAVVAVAVAVLLTPGTAAAAPDRSQPPDVVPLVDCVVVHADGTWTAVFGYDNRTGAAVDIPFGPANQVTPAGYDGDQPTRFAAGVHHGVLAVVVDRGGGPLWHLGRENVPARRSDAVCPTATELPADGNGLAMPMALCGAGVLATVLVHRWRRRSHPH
jgi:hypothetical protein